MSTPTRVFVARLAGLAVFDPLGDQVGKVRDVVTRDARGAPAAQGERARRRGPRGASACSCR